MYILTHKSPASGPFPIFLLPPPPIQHRQPQGGVCGVVGKMKTHFCPTTSARNCNISSVLSGCPWTRKTSAQQSDPPVNCQKSAHPSQPRSRALSTKSLGTRLHPSSFVMGRQQRVDNVTGAPWEYRLKRYPFVFFSDRGLMLRTPQLLSPRGKRFRGRIGADLLSRPRNMTNKNCKSKRFFPYFGQLLRLSRLLGSCLEVRHLQRKKCFPLTLSFPSSKLYILRTF